MNNKERKAAKREEKSCLTWYGVCVGIADDEDDVDDDDGGGAAAGAAGAAAGAGADDAVVEEVAPVEPKKRNDK